MPRLLFFLLLMSLTACASTGQLATATGGTADGLAAALTQLDGLEQPAGVDGADWDRLTAALREQLVERVASGDRLASTPPRDDRSRGALELDGTTLTWRYFMTGDYNQDGWVAVTDITPIGQHYNQAWSYDPTTAVSVIDGDQNGMITVSDITPIGQNYNRQVAGYNVYGSSVADDYPEAAGDSNGGATLLGSVTFDDALGGATERKYFTFTIADAYLSYWVRPVDGDGTEGIASEAADGPSGSIVYEADAQWLGVQGCPGDGMAGPVLVDDAPAVAIIKDNDGSNPLVFLRATDQDGEDWNTPVEVAPVATGYPDLCVVDGNPAVAYCRDGNRDLEFRRAGDAQGTTWPTDPVLIDDTYHNSGMNCALLIVDGYPAVAFTGEDGDDEGILLYVRATDAQGTAWGTPVRLDDGYSSGDEVERLDFALVDGNPAVFYLYGNLDAGTAGLRFVRATDATGAAWGTPVEIDTWTEDYSGGCRNLSLHDFNGIPGVSWYWESWGTPEDCVAYYSQAGDSVGSFWSNRIPISPLYTDGNKLLFSSVQTFENKDGEPMAALACDYPTDLDGNGHTSVFVTEVGPVGGVDWSSVVEMELELDTNPMAASSLGSGRTTSCFSSVDYLLLLIVFVLYDGLTTSDVGDSGVYHCYGFSAGMNGPTVDTVFVHLELPETTF